MNEITTQANRIIEDLEAEGFDGQQIIDAMCDGEALGKSGISQEVAEEVVFMLNQNRLETPQRAGKVYSQNTLPIKVRTGKMNEIKTDDRADAERLAKKGGAK